jgi:hypothetical protein
VSNEKENIHWFGFADRGSSRIALLSDYQTGGLSNQPGPALEFRAGTPHSPTVNHERFLVKVSFKEPLTGAPLLYVGRDAKTRGVRTDTEGRFWMFNVPGLSPDTEYDLVLKTEDGRGLCDSWPLKTFRPRMPTRIMSGF